MKAATPASLVKNPPTECGVCHRRFFEGEFYDAQNHAGAHEIMCPQCFPQFSNGKGVKYKYNESAKTWFKTAIEPKEQK